MSILNSQGEEQTADVVIDVDEMSIDGDYWLPLYKTLNCRYSGRVECTDNLIEITFDGHFDDFRIVGLCSPFAARRLARQKAMDEIEGIVEHGLDLVTTSVQQASSAQGIPVSR